MNDEQLKRGKAVTTSIYSVVGKLEAARYEVEDLRDDEQWAVDEYEAPDEDEDETPEYEMLMENLGDLDGAYEKVVEATELLEEATNLLEAARARKPKDNNDD